METLRRSRLIAKPIDYWVSFDMKDRFYALAIAPQDREAFTINIDGQFFANVCASHGLATKPVHLPKAYGGVWKLSKRPREINKLIGRATLTAYQGKEEVVEASKAYDGSPVAASVHG